MNRDLIKNRLRRTVAEASVPGVAVTDKTKAKSKSENDAYYKEVENKMDEYEKETTQSGKDAIDPPKYNYEHESEVEYHNDMEIRNGQEMIEYEGEPSERFKERATMAIEGDAKMGNSPDYANVVQKGQGGDPDFGKKLVDTIKQSKAKRDAATPTIDQFGDDIEEKNVGVKGGDEYKPSIDRKSVAVESKEETKQPIMETNKIKRLRFKSEFGGVENALALIPESYKVDDKVFELTDGNENYRVRWEGTIEEGNAILLRASDKTLVKEDIDKMKHLMGFKSDLGMLKGSQRLEENNSFTDMLNKSRELMAENEEEIADVITENTREAFSLLNEEVGEAKVVEPITAETEIEKKKD